MGKEINEVIDNLADKLGVTVSKIYDVMRAQAGVEIVKALFCGTLCVGILILCFFYVKKVYVDKDEHGNTIIQNISDDFDSLSIVAHIFFSIGATIVAIIMIVVLIGYVRTVIQCIMNPDYWVIAKILNMATGA